MLCITAEEGYIGYQFWLHNDLNEALTLPSLCISLHAASFLPVLHGQAFTLIIHIGLATAECATSCKRTGLVCDFRSASFQCTSH